MGAFSGTREEKLVYSRRYVILYQFVYVSYLTSHSTVVRIKRVVAWKRALILLLRTTITLPVHKPTRAGWINICTAVFRQVV